MTTTGDDEITVYPSHFISYQRHGIQELANAEIPGGNFDVKIEWLKERMQREV